jgi:hypothetical protein
VNTMTLDDEFDLDIRLAPVEATVYACNEDNRHTIDSTSCQRTCGAGVCLPEPGTPPGQPRPQVLSSNCHFG